jgi:hypothetical protein
MMKVVRLVCVHIPTSEGSIKSWWINGIVPWTRDGMYEDRRWETPHTLRVTWPSDIYS